MMKADDDDDEGDDDDDDDDADDGEDDVYISSLSSSFSHSLVIAHVSHGIWQRAARGWPVLSPLGVLNSRAIKRY